MNEIDDIEPPLDLPDHTWMWVSGTIFILVLLISLFAYWKFRKRNREAVQNKTAWEKALQRLAELERHEYAAKGQWREFYTGLSDALRHYIEDRYGIQAPEMTTEEFLSHARLTEVFSASQSAMIRNLLEDADMVKFARLIPQSQEGLKNFDAVKQLIDDTIPKEDPRENPKEN